MEHELLLYINTNTISSIKNKPPKAVLSDREASTIIEEACSLKREMWNVKVKDKGRYRECSL